MNKILNNFHIPYPGNIDIPFAKGYEELHDFYTRGESQTKDFFYKTIKKDWVVVDVGANIGMMTSFFTKLTDNKIFAFEASEDNFSMLLENLKAVDSSKVCAKNCYISAKTQVEEGEIHYLWTGRGSVSRTKGEFSFITLDDLLAEEDKIDFIKIDIDGYDFEAVQGCVKTLEKHSPLLLVELVDEALALHGYKKEQVIEFLSDQKYRVKHVFDQCNYIFEKYE